MPYSNRTDGKYNRKAEYYLMSVKQRNEVEFRDSLKREKRRHAEDKVDSLIPLGLHNDSEYFDTAELLYLLNCASKDLGKIFIDGIKNQIKEKYDEYELPVPDLGDFREIKANQFNDGWW